MASLPERDTNAELGSLGTGKGKAKELRRRIDERLDTLATAVDDVRVSEAFQQFLAVQARFHEYSWHNTRPIPISLRSSCPRA